MSPADAAKLLELPDNATAEQVEARFLELRRKLEDKIAKALTPTLQTKYRATLTEVTEAYETLTLAADSVALPVLTKTPAAKVPLVGDTAAAASSAGNSIGAQPSALGAPQAHGKSISVVFAIVATIALSILAAGGWYFVVHVPAREQMIEAARLEAARLEKERIEAARGAVFVRTNPPGAEVRVGSFGMGPSPLEVREARLGTFPVTARMAGFEDWHGEITVKENLVAELDIPLVRSMGTLALSSEPSGLEVEIVGRAVSGQTGPAARQNARTPAKLNLPTGIYELTFRRQGWTPQTKTVDVSRGATVQAGVEFIGGNVAITSTPAGADVYSGGRLVGRTPLRLDNRLPGRLEVELQLPGYMTANLSGDLVAREVLTMTATLEKRPGPGPGQHWTIPGLQLEMIPIAPGTFQMGSATPDHDEERPVTRVTISKPFWLGKTEVTQAQWKAVMGGNPSRFQREERAAERPVENVSWFDAMTFCRKLTERERAAGRLAADHVYTLPTEAQWEYACRAGTTGDYAGSLDAMGWYFGNSGLQTRPVGGKKANAWGLHDMHGNVNEWCADWFGDYPGGSLINPTGSPSGEFRVKRGGSSASTEKICRSTTRLASLPDGHWAHTGFRLALRSVR